MQYLVCGIDVSSSELEVCIFDSEQMEVVQTDVFENNRSGIREMISKFTSEDIREVVLEATGGYERRAADMLKTSSIKVSVVNPSQVRHFAKGIGKKAKTDKIDAEVIARFAAVVEQRYTDGKSKFEAQFRDINKRLSQLKKTLKAEKNRLQLAEGTMKESIQRIIDVLEEEIELIESQIKEIVKKDKELSRKVDILTQHKGVGFRTATGLLAFVPELGKVNRKEIAALLGVAPFTRKSGKWKGKSFVSGGRADARKILYMAALVASKHNEKLSEFYNRLISKGKAKKVALTAAMRKLIVICNASLKYA